MSKKKKPEVNSLEDLHKKGTKELLAYLKRLHRCEESFEKSDMEINPDEEDEKYIYFKQTAKWQNAYKNVKAVLADREHIS